MNTSSDAVWRVSVATYNRVLFSHPEDGRTMLALERKATARNIAEEKVHIWSQPFGGAVRILDSAPLQEIVGEIQFDCARSAREQDFRLLVQPSKWEAVKQYCLKRLANHEDGELESSPDRELTEEFAGTIKIDLKPQQYNVRPAGFVIENDPVPTDNIYAPGRPTVRLYRIFEVHILDEALSTIMLETSQSYTDQDLGALAVKDVQSGGKGRVNSILALPHDQVKEAYLTLPPQKRHGKLMLNGHELDESVLAVLGDIEVPQYERVE
jgi:hypothetical protein